MATTSIPSPPACELYVEMALLAEQDHLSLSDTLSLALSRAEQGHKSDLLEIRELLERGWIAGAEGGGWIIKHQAPS